MSYERTMHLCILPAKKSPFRCFADLLAVFLQKGPRPNGTGPGAGCFFFHTSPKDARKEYLWKESG